MKNTLTPSSLRPIALGLATAAAFAVPAIHAANPADWRPFTTGTPIPLWDDPNAWTAGTGVPDSGSTLVINFDPSKAGTTTSGGGISASFTSTNNLGTVQLSTLNVSGSSNGSARNISIVGGALQFSSASASINSTTSGTGAVNYSIGSNILLDGNLDVNQNTNNGTLTLLSLAGSTLSSNTAGLKTVTFAGTGTTSIGTNATAAIADGSGQVGVTMAGTGLLTMGGANTFTGGLLIKSGTVSMNGSSVGLSTSFGAGSISLGDTTGSVNATLLIPGKGGSTFTFNNAVTVQSNNGVKTLENSGGNNTTILGGLLTVNDDLTLKYSGAVGGGITVGTNTTASWLAGAGNLTLENNGTGFITISGSNPGFTGNVLVNSGTARVGGAASLSAANSVAVDSLNNAAFNINNQSQTIAGLNNGSNGGGLVTNSGVGARTLTLAGSGTYTFGGVISAATPANMALTVSLGANGKQILSGNSTYTGATTVTAGTLIINGDNTAATGAVSVTGGTLGGNGIIGGNTTIANNATLSPGASAGKLTFLGTLTLSGADSKALFEIASGARGANYDAVDVGGLLTYNGDMTFAMTGLIANGTYNLFDFGSQTGSFDTIAFGGVGNPYSGTFTNVAGVWTATSGSQTFTFTQATGDLVVIPEPASALLAGLGLTVLLYPNRRNRKARQS